MPETPTKPARNLEGIEVAYTPARRPWRRRLAGAFRSWSRSTFSRESYLSSIRSLLWVVPLTVLIWVYAEREQVVTLSNVTISVDPPAGQPGRLLARFAPGTVRSIHAELRGSQAAAEEIKEVLESSAVSLDPGRELSAGDHAIDIATVLNRDPRLIARGIQIQHCVPAEVTVTVEKIEERMLEVRPRPEDVRGLPPPVFTPAKVQVAIPVSDLNKAEAEDRLFVFANLKPYSEVMAEPGPHDIAPSLSPAFDNPSNTVTISPATVKAHVDRPKGESSIVLDHVAVNAAYPKISRSQQFEADYTSLINKVTVIGPDDKINALRNAAINGGIAPHADFDVDLNGDVATFSTERQATLIFILPAGVKVSDDSQKVISYTLVERHVKQ